MLLLLLDEELDERLDTTNEGRWCVAVCRSRDHMLVDGSEFRLDLKNIYLSIIIMMLLKR